MRLLPIVFLFFINSVSAADFQWYSPLYSQITGSSAYGVCVDVMAATGRKAPAYSFSLQKVVDTFFYCNASGPIPYRVEVRRRGDSCPAGTDYNSTMGACEAAAQPDGTLCESQPGSGVKDFVYSDGQCKSPNDANQAAQCKFYAAKQTSPGEYPYWKYPTSERPEQANPSKMSDALGCEIQLIEDLSCKEYPARITPGVDGADPIVEQKSYKCRATGRLTGNVSGTTNAPEGKPSDKMCQTADDPDCKISDPKADTESKPCKYVQDAEGRMSCQSWQYEGKEGANQCGTVNGKFVCSNDLPKANSNGIQISTNVNTTTKPDGSTETTKTDTMKETKCATAQANSCTTTTTTSHTTIIKDSSGQVTSATGSCTGSRCPDKNTNPDSDGDGFGDCSKNCKEEEEEGDVATPEIGEAATFAESGAAFMQAVQNAPIMQAVDGVSFPAGGGVCPSGTADTYLGKIRIDAHCTLWEQIAGVFSMIMLGVWAFLSIRVLMSA